MTVSLSCNENSLVEALAQGFPLFGQLPRDTQPSCPYAELCGTQAGLLDQLETPSLARHTFPAFVQLREHSARLHELMYTPQDFL